MKVEGPIVLKMLVTGFGSTGGPRCRITLRAYEFPTYKPSWLELTTGRLKELDLHVTIKLPEHQLGYLDIVKQAIRGNQFRNVVSTVLGYDNWSANAWYDGGRYLVEIVDTRVPSMMKHIRGLHAQS